MTDPRAHAGHSHEDPSPVDPDHGHSDHGHDHGDPDHEHSEHGHDHGDQDHEHQDHEHADPEHADHEHADPEHADHEHHDHEHADHQHTPHAVIVGVGPGLGASLARVFAENGHDVTLIARSAASTAPVAAQLSALGRRVLELHVDVSDLEGLAEAIGQARSWQPITRLHHNASRNAGRLLDADPALLRQAIAVNALAPITAVQAALPDLRAAHGTVTWTGGGAALNPSTDYGVLSQGKAALRAAAFALAPELAAQGVRLRMITVRGSIAAGGPLDPDRIAAALWAHSTDPDAPVELQFDGRS